MSAPDWFIPLGIVGLLAAAFVVFVGVIEWDLRREFGDLGDVHDFGDVEPEPRSERLERLAKRNVSRDARRVADP